MKDSRSISQFLKPIANLNSAYAGFEVLDRINPNTFELTKNGRIQTSVYGAFSSLIIKINVIKNGEYSNMEYAIHPNKFGLICTKILDEKLSLFCKQNAKYPEYKGKVFRSIYTNKVVGDKYECSIFNIYFDEENEEFVLGIKNGLGKLKKDDTNRNDFSDFEKKNYIGITIPYEEMELICYQVQKYLNAFELTMTPAMLKGRYTYETRCKTIFKSCKGDAKKVKEIEEKFIKLTANEQQECLTGKKEL